MERYYLVDGGRFDGIIRELINFNIKRLDIISYNKYLYLTRIILCKVFMYKHWGQFLLKYLFAKTGRC